MVENEIYYRLDDQENMEIHFIKDMKLQILFD